MPVATDAGAYPQALKDEFQRIAEECYPCYQCGTCTSSCPSGRELYRGPRRLVRLMLAGEIEAVLKSDDLWRCTECGTCSDVCRMEIDVAGVLHRLRQLERKHGSAIHCAERTAADIATSRLNKQPRIDNMRFGMAMVARGHLPKDKVGVARMGAKIARQMLPFEKKRRPAAAIGPAGGAGAASDIVTLPFYAGCAIPQDHGLHGLVHEVAAGFGVRLDEATDAGCCGHPSRGAVSTGFTAADTVYTACPACDSSLEESGVASQPLWDALTDRARRQGLALHAASPSFVPYVGCLADRDASLAALGDAAEQAGATVRLAYPTLHSGCCGALGGMYRGATKASGMLLEFAAEKGAPVVTPCVLCRDNLRSAARELKLDVPVHFWPEFFRAGEHAPEAASDD
ncbi:MAG TPA: 4Fe-4S dicluster domain-containing protein [Thermoleophilia bacterium]